MFQSNTFQQLVAQVAATLPPGGHGQRTAMFAVLAADVVTSAARGPRGAYVAALVKLIAYSQAWANALGLVALVEVPPQAAPPAASGEQPS